MWWQIEMINWASKKYGCCRGRKRLNIFKINVEEECFAIKY